MDEYKFEMELAYYEMCVNDEISSQMLKESDGNNQSVVKKIWSAVKAAVAKIFQSLASAISGILQRIFKGLNGKSLKEDVDDLKTAMSSAPPKVQNADVEVYDVQSALKANSDAKKEIKTLMKAAQSGKITAEEINDKKKAYKEKMGGIKQKGKIKTKTKVALAGITLACAALTGLSLATLHAKNAFTAGTIEKTISKVSAVSQDEINSACDKAEKDDIKQGTSSGDAGSAMVALSNYNAEVAKDTADIVNQTVSNVKKVKYSIIRVDTGSANSSDRIKLRAEGEDGSVVSSKFLAIQKPNPLRPYPFTIVQLPGRKIITNRHTLQDSKLWDENKEGQ